MNASNLSRSGGTVQRHMYWTFMQLGHALSVHASILLLTTTLCLQPFVTFKLQKYFLLELKGRGDEGQRVWASSNDSKKSWPSLHIIGPRSLFSGDWEHRQMAHTYAAKRSIVKCTWL